MAKAALGGVEVEVDEDGFIQEPDKWNQGRGGRSRQGRKMLLP